MKRKIKSIFNSLGYRVEKGRNIDSNLNKTFSTIRKKNIPMPTLFDIGSGGGIQRKYEYFYKKELLSVFSFDPNKDWNGNRQINLVPHAIGHYDGEHQFYNLIGPGASSCLKPNYENLKRFSIYKYFEIEKVGEIKINRMDNLIEKKEIPIPSFIKLDVQGFEHNCLKGLGKYINFPIAIEVELHLLEVYEGETLFQPFFDYMGSLGFSLRKIKPKGKWDHNIVELDAYFSRKPKNEVECIYLKLWEVINEIPLPEIFTDEDYYERKHLPKVRL